MMERLTNIGSNGEIWITDNDETRRLGRKESAYKKLAEYEDLDEQGLLLRLPCGIGADIDNPLEPLKLQSALQSEIFKYEYRKEHKPQDINILDYTIIYALKHCLEEQLKAGGKE